MGHRTSSCPSSCCCPSCLRCHRRPSSCWLHRWCLRIWCWSCCPSHRCCSSCLCWIRWCRSYQRCCCPCPLVINFTDKPIYLRKIHSSGRTKVIIYLLVFLIYNYQHTQERI